MEGTDRGAGGFDVTVLPRSSPSSTTSLSELTGLIEEFDDDSGDEAEAQLPNADFFESSIESTLAWLLAMEERFNANDIPQVNTTAQPDSIKWSNYCQKDLKRNLFKLNKLSLDEKRSVESLLNVTTDRLKKLHERILSRVDQAMQHFETHEVDYQF